MLFAKKLVVVALLEGCCASRSSSLLRPRAAEFTSLNAGGHEGVPQFLVPGGIHTPAGPQLLLSYYYPQRLFVPLPQLYGGAR